MEGTPGSELEGASHHCLRQPVFFAADASIESTDLSLPTETDPPYFVDVTRLLWGREEVLVLLRTSDRYIHPQMS